MEVINWIPKFESKHSTFYFSLFSFSRSPDLARNERKMSEPISVFFTSTIVGIKMRNIKWTCSHDSWGLLCLTNRTSKLNRAGVRNTNAQGKRWDGDGKEKSERNKMRSEHKANPDINIETYDRRFRARQTVDKMKMRNLMRSVRAVQTSRAAHDCSIRANTFLELGDNWQHEHGISTFQTKRMPKVDKIGSFNGSTFDLRVSRNASLIRTENERLLLLRRNDANLMRDSLRLLADLADKIDAKKGSSDFFYLSEFINESPGL